MNRSLAKLEKTPEPTRFLPKLTAPSSKNPLAISQIVLVSRIMMTIFIVGLVGYSLDKVLAALQHRYGQGGSGSGLEKRLSSELGRPPTSG